MERLDDEITRLRRRFRDEPRSTVFVALADTLRRAGRLGEAMGVLRSGFRVHPDYSAGRVVLARVHLEMGNRALAIDVLEEVVRGDAENIAAGSLLARLLVEDGRVRDARPIVARLAMVATQDPVVQALQASLGARTLGAGVRGQDPFDCPEIAQQFVAAGHYERAARMWRRIDAGRRGAAGVKEHLVELERALQGLADVPNEPKSSGLRRPLPGTASAAEALAEEELARTPPAGHARYRDLARGLWGQA